MRKQEARAVTSMLSVKMMNHLCAGCEKKEGVIGPSNSKCIHDGLAPEAACVCVLVLAVM